MYDIEDVGTLGGDQTRAYGINSGGTVTGYSYRGVAAQAGPYTAFLYPPLRRVAFPGNYTVGYAINSRGHTAGMANWLPFFYNGTPRPINIRSLGDVNGYALALNDSGQVVGESFAPGGSPQTGYTTQAFHWSNGWVRGLGRLGGRRAGARGIDPAGVVVGYSELNGGGPYSFPWYPGHAFIWAQGNMRDLNSLTQCGQPGFASTLELLTANAINARHEIVGMAVPRMDGSVRRAFFARRVSCRVGAQSVYRYLTHDLGTFREGGISYALALNNSGVVVGAAYRDASGVGNYEAALFTGNRVQNLNFLIDSSIYTGTGRDVWRLREATGVNDNGWIVGWGEYHGEIHGFRLIPRAN